eukprot:6132281-Amphidinium_carterae.1
MSWELCTMFCPAEAGPRRLTSAAGTVAIDYTVAVPDANSLSMSAAFGTPLQLKPFSHGEVRQ